MSFRSSNNITLSPNGYQKDSPWSNFRGDRRNSGHSNYVGPSTNELKWSFSTGGSITSTAAVAADGTVYFGSNDFNLYALSSNGAFIWKYLTGGIVASSPCIGSDGTAYFGSYDFYFYAISSTGSLQWKFKTNSSIDSSPAISPNNDAVYFTSNDMFLYALSIQTGSLLWKYQVTHPDFTISLEDTRYVTSSPVVGMNGTIYIGSKDHHVYALSSSGTLIWKFQSSNCIFSSPLLSADDSMVYIATSLDWVGSVNSYYIYAIKATDGSQKWEVQLLGPVFATPALSTDGCIYIVTQSIGLLTFLYKISSEGSLVWQTSAYAISTESSPVLDTNGVLYISSAKSVLYAIDSGTSSVLWSRSHQCANSKSSSPSIGLNGYLYIGSYDSTFYAYQSLETLPPAAMRPSFSNSVEVLVSTDGYQVDAPWSHFRGNDKYSGQSSLVGPLPTSSSGNLRLQWKYRTQAKIVSTPAVSADGTIYIGSTDGKLYALSSVGTVKWSYFINDKILITTPAIGYDGTIFISPHDNSYIYALSKEGSLRWKYSTYKGVNSPIIGASASNSSNVFIYAAGEVYLNSWTYEGTLRWQFALATATNFFNSPVLAMNSSVLYIGTLDSYLYAVSSDDGSFLWRFKIDEPAASQALMFTPAIGSDNVIYIVSYDSCIYAISPSGLKLWKYCYSDAGVTSDDLNDASLPAVAIATNGNIYIGSKDCSLYAISASPAGGSALWHYKTDGEIYTSPSIGADGTVYFGSYDKNVYAVSSEGSFLWKYPTFKNVVGSPVVSYNNTLYVGSTDGYLYAITSALLTTKTGSDFVSNTFSPTYIVTKSSFQGNTKQPVVLSSPSEIIICSIVGVCLFIILSLYAWFSVVKATKTKRETRLLEMKNWILSDGGGSVKVATSVKEKLDKELFFSEYIVKSKYARHEVNMSDCVSGDTSLCTSSNSDATRDIGESNSLNRGNKSLILGFNDTTGAFSSGSSDLIDCSHLSHKVNEYVQMDQQLTQVTNSLKVSNLLISQHLEGLQQSKASSN